MLIEHRNVQRKDHLESENFQVAHKHISILRIRQRRKWGEFCGVFFVVPFREVK